MSTITTRNQCNDLSRENKENNTLIWLDQSINDSEDSVRIQTILRELNNYVQFYTDLRLCINYIHSVKNEKIFLIISGSLAQTVLPDVHSILSVYFIFIFCHKRENHMTLLNQYSKIINIFTKVDTLTKSIRDIIRSTSKQTLAFNLFDQQKQKTVRDLSNDSASFLWYQLLIDVLKQMPQTDNAEQEMLSYCRSYYEINDDKNELKKIELFYQTYKSNKAIEWYTDECFLYKLLNKALRTEDIELLYLFRFFIIDLCAQIECDSKQLLDIETLTLYRGQKIAIQELEKLKQNVGILISTNGFLSTTQTLRVAIEFTKLTRDTDELKTILFEIKVNPSQLKTVIFADIDQKSTMKGEKEVLFSLGAVFKIESVEYDTEMTLWKIQMVATDEGSKDVEEYLKLQKQETEEYTPTILFGRLLLIEMGQIEKAEKYFYTLLKTLPKEHADLAAVIDQIGNVFYKKGDLNSALEKYKEAYELRLKRLPFGHPHLAASLNNIANVYDDQGNCEQALNYYEQAKAIDEKNYSDIDHLNKARTMTNIALVYKKKKDYNTALNYMRRAYEMHKRLLSSHHPKVANSLWNIGSIYDKKAEYNQVLKYYTQAFEIETKILPDDHIDLGKHFAWIIDIYKRKGDHNVGLEFCRKQIALLGENHSRTAHIFMSMGNLFIEKDPDQALSYYGQALVCTPLDQATKMKSLQAISTLYYNYGMFEEALTYHQKVLDIQQSRLFSENHPDIGWTLQCLGQCYFQMDNYTAALSYLQKARQIYESNYSRDHEKVTRIQNDIERVKTTEKGNSLPLHWSPSISPPSSNTSITNTSKVVVSSPLRDVNNKQSKTCTLQ
ncbi:unnamed protein product [Didymodactylos carnosus]|uniref:Uncharacterized protein n=1 Tax=Didymodactylos carnosus TaxID=1234261 RepID=A0A814LX42_9BILA|nr:unnamed protein product [Didymodactylos carnosus]CAF1070838.1 unnamed protein product [Didymodactylos carnosus]CAF3738888.1 unnamed protein product [Didymodactylos carnosus]CAF3837962.1 unnamed protein product [Didymodactylos carnosus]